MSDCRFIPSLSAFRRFVYIRMVWYMPRRAIKNQPKITIEELKVFIRSQPYKGRLKPAEVPMVKVEHHTTK